MVDKDYTDAGRADDLAGFGDFHLIAQVGRDTVETINVGFADLEVCFYRELQQKRYHVQLLQRFFRVRDRCLGGWFGLLG